MSALELLKKILRIWATEGFGGVTARIRRRWRLWTFRPCILEKQYGGFRFEFYVGTREGQEWYGKFVDTRLYKPVAPELTWLASAAKRGDIVADVGAHHAYFALLFSHWVGDNGTVFAFECLPENAEIAERNVRLNRLRNVQVVKKAVGARSGTVEVADNSGGILVDRASTANVITVEMIALDEFFGRSPPSLLKIDVEGYELEVLKGARVCLAARPTIALEFHCFKFKDPTSQVEEILRLLPKDRYHYKLAREAGEELTDYSISGHSAGEIGRQYNPHLYGIPAPS